MPLGNPANKKSRSSNKEHHVLVAALIIYLINNRIGKSKNKFCKDGKITRSAFDSFIGGITTKLRSETRSKIAEALEIESKHLHTNETAWRYIVSENITELLNQYDPENTGRYHLEKGVSSCKSNYPRGTAALELPQEPKSPNIDHLFVETHPKKLDAGSNPSLLLQAANELVEFYGRDTELKMLDDWLSDPAATPFRVITGVGGAGKTRLLLEWSKRVKQREQYESLKIGFLASTVTDEDIKTLASKRHHDVVVIIDYAEHRQEVTSKLLAALVEHQDSRLHVVLLARSLGIWWEDLMYSNTKIARLISGKDWYCPLRGFANEVENRHQFFAGTLAKLSQILAMDEPSSDSIARYDLNSTWFQHPLLLIMAAYLFLHGESYSSEGKIFKAILGHEKQYWYTAFVDLSLFPTSNSKPRYIDKIVAMLTLCNGATTKQQAQERISTLLSGNDVPDRALDIAKILQGLLGSSSSHWIHGLQPDRLGEWFASKTLEDHPDLISCIFDKMDRTAWEDALSVLVRMINHHPTNKQWLQKAIEGRIDKFGFILVRVLMEPDKHHGPVLMSGINIAAFEEVFNFLPFNHPIMSYLLSFSAKSLFDRQVKRLTDNHSDDNMRLYIDNVCKLMESISITPSRSLISQFINESEILIQKFKSRNPTEYLHHLGTLYDSAFDIYFKCLDHNSAHDIAENSINTFRKLKEYWDHKCRCDYLLQLGNYTIVTREDNYKNHHDIAPIADEMVLLIESLDDGITDEQMEQSANSLSNAVPALRFINRQTEALMAFNKSLRIYRILHRKSPGSESSFLLAAMIAQNTLYIQEQITDDCVLSLDEEARFILNNYTDYIKASRQHRHTRRLVYLGSRFPMEYNRLWEPQSGEDII